MSSKLSNLTNTIHIRDFILDVGPDLTKSDSSSSAFIEIQSDVNIFADDEVQDSTIIAEPIHACLRVFIKDQDVRDLYVPEAFFYAHGRFHTAITKDNKMKIIVQVFSIERYDCSAIALSIE